LRFTVHRPPRGEVSLCWYRPSGGDVSCRVHVGVARPCTTGDAREDRLALAVFGRPVPTGRTSLRRVRSRDAFESARSLVAKPGSQLTPPLTTDRAVKPPFLCDSNAGSVNRAARRASHRPHVERLDPNGVKPARQIRCRLLHPVSPPIGFARFDSGDSRLRPLATVGATLGSRKTSLQPAQSDPLARPKTRAVQQLASGQRRRHRHTAIDTDHAAIGRPCDRVGDMRERNMPASGPIPSDAVGLGTCRHGSGPAESDPADLGHPHPPVMPVELFDMARFYPDLSEAFMLAGLPPRRTAMGAGEKVPHGLREVTQSLLLHRLGPSRQPVVVGADFRQLRGLLVVPRSATARLPKFLLLHAQIPYEPRMPTMLQQHHLLSRCWQQPEPRHTRNLATATDTNGLHASAHIGVGVLCQGFQPKENP
jgi:hypothetical protein